MTPSPFAQDARVWPLADLFDALRREGFHLRPDDYVEVDLVLEAFKPASPAELQALLAPLLVASDEEQEKFDSIFNSTLRNHQLDYLEVKTRRRVRDVNEPWGRLIAGMVAVLFGLYVAFFWQGPIFDASMHVVHNASKSIEVGDTLQFSVDSTLQMAPKAWAQWRWETPDGRLATVAAGPHLQITPTEAGTFVVGLRSQRRMGLLVPTWAPYRDTAQVVVCPHLPAVALDSSRLPGPTPRVLFTAQPARTVQQMQHTEWRLDGKVVATNQPAWEARLPAHDSLAFHEVRFLAYPDASQLECASEATCLIAATKTSPFRVELQQTGEPIELQKRMHPAYIWALAAIGACLAGLFVVLTWLEARVLAPKTAPEQAPGPAADSPLARFSSNAPPLEIPLENREADLIVRDQLFHRTVRLLRQPTAAENQRLHIGRTMQATMQRGGFPTLVYEPHRSETEYLFLIDRSQIRSQQVALFEYLFKAFAQESVCVERFFFQKTFDRFTNEVHPKGLSLGQLAERYRTNTLLVWSDGAPLLYPAYPVVEPFIREAVAEWPMRALITPVPLPDWGSQERALQTAFLVYPADVTGQLHLLQALTNHALQPEATQPLDEASYSAECVDFEDAGELRAYLGDDLFQWVAATAIYPRVRWEVVVEMGRLLLPDNLLNFSNLLKVARITWMRAGSCPNHTRLGLLKQLRPANEALARRTLLQMLAYAEQYFPGEHFYDGEKYVLQTVNQFLLHAYQPNVYAQYAPAQQEFKVLYDRKLYTDGAALRYLENPSGSWSTLLPPAAAPPANGAKQAPGGHLAHYLATLPGPGAPPDGGTPPTTSFRRLLPISILWALAFLLGLFLYLGSVPKAQQATQAEVPIGLTLSAATCVGGTSAADTAALSRWAVFLGKQRVVFQGPAALAFLPVASLDTLGYRASPDVNTVSAVLTIIDTKSQEQQQQLATFRRNHASIRIICFQPATAAEKAAPLDSSKVSPSPGPLVHPPSPSPKVKVSIRFATGNGALAKQLQKRLRAQGYDVPSMQQTSTLHDSTRVRYFPRTQNAEARKVAQVVAGLFKRASVPIVLAQGALNAPFEVWINRVVPKPSPSFPDTSTTQPIPPQPVTTPEPSIAQQTVPKTDTTFLKRILWVDDYPENNATLVRRFKALRIEVVQVRDNQAALAALDRGQRFNLIISDIGRDKEGSSAGIELLRKVKQSKTAPPFAFYSSTEQVERIAKEASLLDAFLVTSNAYQLERQVTARLGLK